MNELIALGTSYKTAGVAVREKIALTEAASERFMRELVAEETISEAVVLSTCNRTELYLVVGDPVEAESIVLGALARRAGVRPTELVGGIYSLRNCDAARHLYRVASGLESMVIGEAEVQGQVKRAYEAALAAQSTGPLTNKLFRAALATGKRVRTDTAISAGRGSVASVAVDAARDALGDLGARHVLIIGAGETAELTARALHAQGVRTMFVANRRRERAAELARRFGGATVAFDALPEELAKADIVVASTSSPHLILGAEELGMVVPVRNGRPLLLIDLAVPRDIDPACAELPGVTLLDVDGLQRQVARHQLVRRTEARKAEGIVEDEIQAFAGWLGSLEVMPTLTALRTRADDVVSGLLAENEGRWESLSAADRERVEKLARTAVSTAAPRADRARAPARRRAPPRPALPAARAVRARRAAGGGRARRGRRGPPAAAPRRELTPLRVGTRGSALALIQARWVAERLPGAEIVEITTSGDQARAVGDKSRWVDTIEAALVAGEIDLAVHSAKDVPGELAEGCELAATPPRAAAARRARAASFGPSDLREGTGGTRRSAAARSSSPCGPDLEVVELRGNVDTRLRKLDDGRGGRDRARRRGLERLGIGARPSSRSTSCPRPGRGRWPWRSGPTITTRAPRSIP